MAEREKGGLFSARNTRIFGVCFLLVASVWALAGFPTPFAAAPSAGEKPLPSGECAVGYHFSSGACYADTAPPVTVYSSPTYTISNTSYNVDTQAAISASSVTVFTNPATGEKISLSGVPTTSGLKLTLLGAASGYFGNIQTLTTPTAVVSFQHKDVDTAISTVAYLNDIGTKITGTQNLTIGAGGSAVAHISFRQSANNNHPTGDSKVMCVFVNATSGEEGLFDASSMSASFDNANCVPYGSAASQTLLANTVKPNSAAMTGSYVTGYVCSGVDFALKDAATHYLDVKYAALGTTNPGAQNTTGVSFVGADYYTDQNGKLSLLPGCVTDTGAAIQAIQSIAVPVD
jgi:hypothetical protein